LNTKQDFIAATGGATKDDPGEGSKQDFITATGGATTDVPCEGSKQDFIAAPGGATTEVPCEDSRCWQGRHSAQIMGSLTLYYGEVESATVADSSTDYSGFFSLFIC